MHLQQYRCPNRNLSHSLVLDEVCPAVGRGISVLNFRIHFCKIRANYLRTKRLKFHGKFRTYSASKYSAHHLELSFIDTSSQVNLVSAPHFQILSYNVIAREGIVQLYEMGCLICIPELIWENHFPKQHARLSENLEQIKNNNWEQFFAKNWEQRATHEIYLLSDKKVY